MGTAHFAFDLQFGAVALRDVLHNGKAQARAAGFA